MAGLGYNAADVPPDEYGEAIPAGRYKLLITDSELAPNKKGTGKVLKYTGTIQGPSHAGRKYWPRFNIFHSSEAAQRIGRQDHNKFIEAAGLVPTQVTDSSQLHNKVIEIELTVEQGERGLQNDHKGFYKVGGPGAAPVGGPPRVTPQAPAPATSQAPTAAPAQAEQSAQQPAAAGSEAPPWARG